ncbi:hypothetical protein PIB30_048817 [Stylosanthes scabra]|uniref:DEK-C domain-containing protein n=1 Tax=Stylosanthes scabra TaxID=79078 RepID=A0ABU6QHC4_9FABA|nr:hypothetical protein [Stylosanthes scabra]
MTEETPDTDTPKNDAMAEAPVIVESQIETAMLSRVPHFKEQADSLTFEGVRRLLEKDLELEEFALDVHKRFIKQCLLKCLEGVGSDDSQKISEESGMKGASTKAPRGSTDESQSKDAKDGCPEDEEKMEDSPVLGLLKEKEQKEVKQETEEDKDNGGKVVPSETLIKKALRKRATYIRNNSENVTLASLRRLLEEDLKLDKFALDPYKKFISQQLDEVLNSSEISKPANNAKKIVKKGDTKVTKKLSSEEENSDASANESDEEEEVKPRKKMVTKAKKQSTTEPKKRRGSMEEKNLPSKKRTKPAKDASEDGSDAEGSGGDSEDQSHSSREKPKKKEVSTPVYGKRVEHLKSVIKACGMSVPPSIYKKVKQAPENKRETQLIKELEEILSREGLSSDPSEKEIKEVRKKKERAKELEGIDLSNIVSSSRRRSVTSFAPPPPPPPKPKNPPKIPVETNGDDAKGSDHDKDDEVNDDEEDEEDEDDEEEEDSSDDEESQSDEFNEDEDDSD